MKSEFLYERRQTAGRMEAVMLVVTGVALIGAIFTFLSHGWLPGLGLLILGSIAFALSRLFDLIGDLFAAMYKPGDGTKPQPAERVPQET